MHTIFLVDDDELLRAIIARFLKGQGYEVRSFSSPRRLLSDIGSGGPDLVISDVQMPEMDGLELVASIRKISGDLPVVLITGYLTPEVRNRARDLGVAHVLEKPIKDLSRLGTIVEGAVSSERRPDRSVAIDRLRNAFLMELSHELRTPLAAIKLAVDGLSAGPLDRSNGRERLLGITRRNVDRLTSLVENQLDLLRISLAEEAMPTDPVSIEEMIDDLSRDFSARFSVERIAGNGADRVVTDRKRLKAVIKYIVENGSSGDGTPVGITTDVSSPPRRVRVHFKNTKFHVSSESGNGGGWNGCGDADSFASRQNKGARFGLDTCRRIIASLGGEMWIDDDESGECVTLALPGKVN